MLRTVIADYLEHTRITTEDPHYQADNLAMAMSLVASTRSVGLLPALAHTFLLLSTVSRPLRGEAPTIDLVIGYSRTNRLAVLKLFLSQLPELTSRGAAHARVANGVLPYILPAPRQPRSNGL